MAKFYQGYYQPKNPQKYLGNKQIYFRSSWEHAVCEFLDNSSSVIGWASEMYRIPYRHPFTGKVTTYVPDFFVVYRDRDGNILKELIEVKPSKQILENAKKKSDKMMAIVNHEKWKMAELWCKQHDVKFRVLTEHDIFRNPGNKK